MVSWPMYCVIFVYFIILTNANIYFNPLSDEFIDLINSKQSTWIAGRNFPSTTSLSYIKKLMGTRIDPREIIMEKKLYNRSVVDKLPENFDARDYWPNCPTIKEIRDQGSCGSDWVFGVVETISDRYCIYSNGTKNFHFSAEDILSCCTNCGFGCDGGVPLRAWRYLIDNGVVSGGNYNSSEGCKPYTIPSCEHHMTGNRSPCTNKSTDTPRCVETCDSNYNYTYTKDKQYGKSVYHIVNDEEQIKAEIYSHGPVQSTFELYTDFLNYKSGVYRNLEEKFLGFHVVKILGWGVENGTKYWLVANSWNTDWGADGFFKIRRGDCGIERYVIAGDPLQSWFNYMIFEASGIMVVFHGLILYERNKDSTTATR